MRIIKALILVVVAVLLVALAVANRQTVMFSLDPFEPAAPAVVLTVPLYWIVFAALALGVIAGGLFAGLRTFAARRAARRETREAAFWKAEAERLRARVDAQATPASVAGSPASLPAPASRAA